MLEEIQMPAEWVVELLEHRPQNNGWSVSPSFSSWIVLKKDSTSDKPRTLDECVEFLSLPLDRSRRLPADRCSYRIRNIRTGEIIPGDIFIVE